MLYFLKDDAGVWCALEDRPHDLRPGEYASRNDFRSMKDAEAMAAALGPDFLAVDYGQTLHPRFDVVVKPQVGDPVSRYFNGDAYPDGTIAHISPTLKTIRTTTGNRYIRRGQSGTWMMTGGVWMMWRGHVTKRNLER